AGEHRAYYAVRQEPLLDLQSKETEWSEVDAGCGLFEPLETLVGLAGIGAAHMDLEAPGHLPGGRILVLGVYRNELGEVPGDEGWHIECRIAVIEEILGGVLSLDGRDTEDF